MPHRPKWTKCPLWHWSDWQCPSCPAVFSKFSEPETSASVPWWHSAKQSFTLEGHVNGELYMGVDLNSCFSKRPFLAKKNYFSETFAISTKTFVGPYAGLYVGISGRKQELDKGRLSVWATIKTHSAAAAHSHVVFCFSRWSLLTFSGQFWHFHTETEGSPASCPPGNKT